MLPLKLGLIQTLSRLCSLKPDFGRNADWLLEQCHRIWLAVEINGSWKRFFLALLIALKNLREWSAVSGEKGFAVFFIVLRSCGRKICLNMCHIKNSCPYLLRFCFIYGTNASESRSWIPPQVVDREQDAFCLAVQGSFVGIIIKVSAGSRKVTGLLFAFAFCKNKPGKLVCSLDGCLLISINKLSEFLRPAVKQQHNKGELQSVFVILIFILFIFIGQLSIQF